MSIDSYLDDDDACAKLRRLIDEKCDQHGCDQDWTVKYRIKKTYSSCGEELTKETFEHWRKFCKRHSTRGDCGREDSDRNYEEIERRVVHGS